MKIKLKIKRIIVILFTFTVVGIGYYMFQFIINPKQINAVEVNRVQQVSGLPKIEFKKTIPTRFNGNERKVVYLTFDDGPGKYTANLLDILKKNNVKATFFLIGDNVKMFSGLVKREQLENHYIGMHSMTHDYKKLYTNKEYVKEMKEDQSLIKSVIGNSPKLTRPPYGSMPGLNESLRGEVVRNNMKVWDWTIDSLDWKYNKVPVNTAATKIVQNVLAGATSSNEIILMHDIHPQSVAAVPEIIKGLKEKGYEFESYDENNHFPINFWHDSRI
ncbi:peptidoglycan-N-acetylglucosamine deacetylase [Bacillus thuringiensis]|uniref:peptidoglycan-N-acetylglucosamine deacetylase n=1 Tax=Bacillus thuringiensis TaxID=1428 RepID=UPI000BF5B9AF|nr:polysaccharide deacetylase family protein [Bacillus thuringiensis]PEV45124.1 peptidoglycan-N-acetylglucosamine deacetylase [Bacillus thuringiensis]PFR66277.1 peptidoglycan-N-acetylglucosamine deacetylase [Bacillus thuringiensis]PFT74633.1 peptidoglycan-N-acetylglucosamine deacetylase [Bacillus thuringiensis]PFV84828.1 peptidoglycan-N-acetylglucosamine deacetylase [Bacillus thuringiensis]